MRKRNRCSRPCSTTPSRREGDSVLGNHRHRLSCPQRARPGRLCGGGRLFTKALSILKTLDGAESPDATTVKMHLAELYLGGGPCAEAEILLRKVVAAREREANATPADVAAAKIDLALACSSQGRKREAEELLRAAMPAIETSFGADSPMLLSVLDPLASGPLGAAPVFRGPHSIANGPGRSSSSLHRFPPPTGSIPRLP